MVLYDQLRISDDGQSMFIDAHVNQASYFDNVYLKKITICTEDQVSEINPQIVGDKFIYQADIASTIQAIPTPLYNKTRVLSESQLIDAMLENGGWGIRFIINMGYTVRRLDVVLSGKFSVCGDTLAPKLVVANNAFNPETDSLESPDVLFTVNGTYHEEKGHDTWLFKGHGEIGQYSTPKFYLYKQVETDTYEYVRLDETDDVNFLHFLWQVWVSTPQETKKELHLVLGKSSFDEAFNNTNEGEPIDPSKPIATVSFSNADLSHNMFFVYIETTPIPIDVPCSLGGEITLGVTFDYDAVFTPAMNYTRQLADKCEIPSNFIDFILNFNALKLAIETEHYVPAIQYWRNLMGDKGMLGARDNIRPCGCHG